VKKSEQSGIEVSDIIGDTAYSEKENIGYAQENNINLVSKLSKTVTHQQSNRTNPNTFEFNKNAQMYVCQAGHMSFKKTSTRPKKHAKYGTGTVESYHYDVEKCKSCPFKEGCYKEGAKDVTLLSHLLFLFCLVYKTKPFSVALFFAPLFIRKKVLKKMVYLVALKTSLAMLKAFKVRGKPI